MPKTKLSRVEVRMTPEEKENLKRKADEAHMTVSKYIIHQEIAIMKIYIKEVMTIEDGYT